MEQALAHGAVVARRYRLESRLGTVGRAEVWRAVDEVLGRVVVVDLIPTDDPRASPAAQAARAAAAVHDPRFLRVLDAATTGSTLYVVREWVAGRNLASLLASGPLPPASAGVVAREVAEAVTAAHEQGLCHLRLDPTTVIVADDGAIKITGLATEAALHGDDCSDTAGEDARGIGRILYAALTGRWPGADCELPPAPRVDGRIASPRQVRAGVPRELDAVADRVLGEPPRQGSRLTEPRAVAAALATAVPAVRGQAHLDPAGQPAMAAAGPGERPPAQRLPADGAGRHGGGASRTVAAPARSAAGGRPAERRVSRVVGVAAVTLLLLGVALLGWQLLTSAFPGVVGSRLPPAAAQPEATAAVRQPSAGTEPANRVVPVVGARDFDPAGDPPEENPLTVGEAIDGNLATAWSTMRYFDPLQGQKPGVGLILDLGAVHQVGSVRLALVEAGADVQLRVAPDGTEPPTLLSAWRQVAVHDAAGTDVRLEPAEPVRTRYLLIWFTSLPVVPGGYRDGVAEVSVRS